VKRIAQVACSVLIISLLPAALVESEQDGRTGGLPIQGSPASPTVSLTPESLRMPRTNIAFSDRMLFLFNGRGAVSLRDKTVTGLQDLLFPPIDILNYHFQLAFLDNTDNILIQDIVPDVYEQRVRTGAGPHPLGLNFTPGSPYVMLLQSADWQPNLFRRTGTFHKEFHGHWISFAIESKTRVSADADEVYLEVQVSNRETAPLILTVIPQQSAPELSLDLPNVHPQPSGPVTHPDAFTLASNQIRINVVSDRPHHTGAGWGWEIPGHEQKAARFAIVLREVGATSPDVYAPDIAQRMERADQALRDRLQWAAGKLPRIQTADRPLNELYARCILSVLDTRWERENFIVRPFYSVGTWVFTIPWDTSYASELLALLDPEGLKEAFLTYIRAGLMKSSWVPWNGKANTYWYAQNPFAEMRILQDYLRQTGDLAFLDQREAGATVFEWMKHMGEEVLRQYGRSDGLLDFGEGSEKMLEIRTDGYQHMVAATNGMAVAYLRQIAEWCRARNDPEAAQFDQRADRLLKAMNEKLWNESAGWFDNLYPDGSHHLVWSYHLFDLLDTDVLTEVQRRRLASHLVEGEFLAPYGMYSISKADLVHWDLEDVDWGGGGQYTGHPLRIAESLYRHGKGELAWDILSRCTLWTQSYPYIPQEIFGDYTGYPEVEMPLEIAAGSGVQAILFGLFGLRPQMDGSLEILPSYHRELGEAKMQSYRFRAHSYDVTMGPWGFQVYRDGKLAAQHSYGDPVEFPKL